MVSGEKIAMGELGHLDNVTDELQNLSISGQSGAGGLKTEKDPRTIARRYQIDLCKKALDENVIVYLETGCGKTHIAVLLMYEMSSRIMKPQKEICVFLAPTVALVEQQSRVIQNSLDFKVGTYCGNSKHLKSHHDWEEELEKHEVLVMTPQILLHNLSHCYIRIELIALLIFDECHYAQSESNHPYAEIMKVFYKPNVKKLPRIFGMTASPKHGKGASITSLENLLHSKVYSVEDRDELEQFVSSPKVNVYYYVTATSSYVSPLKNHSAKLEEIKHKYVSTLSRQIGDHNSIKSIKRDLQRLHSHLLFCLENLGLWGVLQASRILLKGDLFERTELIEVDGQCSDNVLCGRYLAQVASVFHAECANGNGTEADLSSMEALTVPFFSSKLLRLVGILSNFRVQPDMKCIIFVNRIITARSLSYILGKLRILSSWKCDFLVGVHSGLKSMSRKSTNTILDKFRSGELNLLVATKVGEEGLDIQTCCLVIRFDIPETVASFIQSRGRARMPQSEYALLVDRGNQKEMNLIHNFQRDEAQMTEEISSQTSAIKFVDFKERTYKVDSTGATISSGTSISLLHRYCSKLPHDEYFNPKPQFFYFDDAEGTVCHMILPANAPMHQIVSAPQSSMEMAKKDVCLKACKELHAVGALTDYLLPDQDNEVDKTGEDISDSDCDDEGYSRRELHEMLVPSIFIEPLIGLGSTTTSLSSYFIKFKPNPDDRIYKEFGLFVKAPLPGEAERMKLDLHLVRGRCVMTELVPCRVVDLIENQVILAKKFQEMCLKVILDRADFISDFVSLGQDDPTNSISSTFYLMLPVIIHEYKGVMSIDIDWELVSKCLSSPIFRNPAASQKPLVSHSTKWLHLVNGPVVVEDVVNSLVYVQCKDIFYFVSDIVLEKNSYSTYKESTNHIKHYVERYKVHLSYPYQPLIKAKQLFNLDNLLRKKGYSESREKEEHFVELPAEICQLKIIGFSKDIGSSLSLLPSIMHRLESLLVAVELKNRLAASFPEGSEVAADRILEALTTEDCNECFSLERLEVLGDAFLKFAVGRHLFLLHDTMDEGQLTRKRSDMVNNSNLFKLAVANNLHVYVRDQSFIPCYFFALGRRCSVICTDDTKVSIHSSHESNLKGGACAEVRCNKCHHWLQKKTVADVVEALVGAYIVDSGFKAATAFLKWIGILVDFDASQVTKICEASKNFIPLGSQIDIASLEDLLGYQFQHKGLLLQAFVHPSYNYHSGGCYQRLEFLGDAVLDYLITSYLYSVYPDLKPGQLTDLRSASVNNNSFADVAVDRCFHKFILCDSSSLTESMNKYADLNKTASSQKNLVDAASCPKALGDLVESCIGAILLDTGFNLKLVWRIMLSFLDHVMKFSSLQFSPIRELQELCQCYNWDLKFSSQKKDGVFSVEAKVDIGGVSATASATNISRKSAKRLAAKQLYSTLKDRGYKTRTKSLQQVLNSCSKKKAKLIGFDEIPILLKELKNLMLQESSLRGNFQKVHPVTIDPKKNSTPNVKHSRQPIYECHSSIVLIPKTNEESGLNADLQTKGGQHKVSAKSHLYEVCAGNCWKPPVFECCKETGPSHLKEFIFKVVVEMEEDSDMTFECTGYPQTKKKDAAESAAQGAIWYLKRKGYLLPKD